MNPESDALGWASNASDPDVRRFAGPTRSSEAIAVIEKAAETDRREPIVGEHGSLVILPEQAVKHLVAQGACAVVVEKRRPIDVHETHVLAVALTEHREPAKPIEAAPDPDSRARITDWSLILLAEARQLGSTVDPRNLDAHRCKLERRTNWVRPRGRG
jgi:hypothetical protein